VMLWALVILLLFIAIFGGIFWHPVLFFLLAIVFVIAFVAPRPGRWG
jgi:hypothetical protein